MSTENLSAFSNFWNKKNNKSLKISDLDSKFQKPYPQSGGVEFGVEFLLDCKPPRGVPEPTSKCKPSKTSFILDSWEIAFQPFKMKRI